MGDCNNLIFSFQRKTRFPILHPNLHHTAPHLTMQASLALTSRLSHCVVRRACRHPAALPPGQRPWSINPSRRRCVTSATADNVAEGGGIPNQDTTRTTTRNPGKPSSKRDLRDSHDTLRATITDPTTLVKAVASGKAKGGSPRWRRVEFRPVLLKKGGVKLQVVKYDERQAFTSNHDYLHSAGVVQGGRHYRGAARGRNNNKKSTLDAIAITDEALNEGFGNWRVETLETITQVKVLKNGSEASWHTTKALLSNAKGPAGVGMTSSIDGAIGSNVTQHDREKPRLLTPSSPFLKAVGVATSDGKSIKANRRDKYKQVEEFVKLIDLAVNDVTSGKYLETATQDRPVRLVDLGCGNAYLTFGAYAHLTGEDGDKKKESKKIHMEVVGVDIKRQSRETNSRVALDLGWENNCVFVEGTIADADVKWPTPREEELNQEGGSVDVVLALHACDTATDEALVRAVKWRAPLTLVAPCCHHDLQVRLRKHSKRAEEGGLHNQQNPLMKHGILRERLGDVLTDAWRAHILRLLGHRVEVSEWIGGEHTPRNTMIKAVFTNVTPSKQLWHEYDAMVEEWGVVPRLAEMLETEMKQAREKAFAVGDAE